MLLLTIAAVYLTLSIWSMHYLYTVALVGILNIYIVVYLQFCGLGILLYSTNNILYPSSSSPFSLKDAAKSSLLAFLDPSSLPILASELFPILFSPLIAHSPPLPRCLTIPIHLLSILQVLLLSNLILRHADAVPVYSESSLLFTP
jgi:hypothetical protein